MKNDRIPKNKTAYESPAADLLCFMSEDIMVVSDDVVDDTLGDNLGEWDLEGEG